MSASSLDYTFHKGRDLSISLLYFWCLAHAWHKQALTKNYELINCSRCPFVGDDWMCNSYIIAEEMKKGCDYC